MRQGADIGTQYRSAIYFTDEAQGEQAQTAKAAYTRRLAEHRKPPATSEIAPAGEFYYAEAYPQQYLEKNPFGYCPDHGRGSPARSACSPPHRNRSDQRTYLA
jgi:peptide-methionine (S)-S-oxide reductase